MDRRACFDGEGSLETGGKLVGQNAVATERTSGRSGYDSSSATALANSHSHLAIDKQAASLGSGEAAR